ncbi:MAG: hypothetical protein LBJ97_04795 [Mycoplasmataceae bacterium]|nr:hypothetical protein [Mycoplasmataceae bacterium]
MLREEFSNVWTEDNIIKFNEAKYDAIESNDLLQQFPQAGYDVQYLGKKFKLLYIDRYRHYYILYHINESEANIIVYHILSVRKSI